MNKVVLGSALLFLIFSLGACSSDESSTVSSLKETISSLKTENSILKNGTSENGSNIQDEINSSTEVSETSSNTKLFSLGEEAIIGDSSGKEIYGLKIIKATTNITNTSEFYTDGKPDNTIEITYEYRNINYNEPMLISSQFISAFDKDGKAGKDMNMMDGQTEVSSGRSAQSTIWFVMDQPMKDQNEVEIEYHNDFSLGFEDVIKFKVTLEH